MQKDEMTDNLQKIRDIVARYDREITLIAATKTQPKCVIDEFMSIAPDFVIGENKVQELLQKYDAEYKWHFIGQLQTNKVKYIVDKVDLIHSLDRIELAKEIEKQARKQNKVQDCLVEINMGAEISKGGVAADEAVGFIKSLAEFEHLRVVGLMSVMPNLGDSKELHGLYNRLYSLFEQAKLIEQKNVDVRYLSAGMTNDFEIALEHGANMIRLGRALFGERVYAKKDI